MGKRRKRGTTGLSRRSVLAGGFITAGGVLVLSETGAFSQLAATRNTPISASSDEDALLGLEIVDVAAVGDDSDLVTITNNAAEELTVSVEFVDSRPGESIDPPQATLVPGASEQFVASLGTSRTTDGDPIDIAITAVGQYVTAELSRTIPVPSFSWAVFDDTQYGDVRFDIQYDVGGVPNVDVLDVTVRNTNTDASASYHRTAASGIVTYPSETDRDWDAAGDEYEITFDASDETGEQVLYEVVTITGGESDGAGDPGSEDDPQLDWVFVDDRSHPWDGSAYTVYYQVSPLDQFGDVEITFDHAGDYATERHTTTQHPVGMVEYAAGEYGLEFDIVANVRNDSGFVVDSTTRSDTANGDNPTNPDTTEPDSPTFATIDIADESGNGGAAYVVDYTIDNDARFGEVQARFENRSGADETNETFADSSTSGTIEYDADYTEGDEYRITLRIFETRDGVRIPVETVVYTDVADGQDP